MKVDPLTPTEREVAELAAAGRTNQQVADTLAISRRTVEAHLQRVYRKLGVRSRHDLASSHLPRPNGVLTLRRRRAHHRPEEGS